jgi:hypothetical protein
MTVHRIVWRAALATTIAFAGPAAALAAEPVKKLVKLTPIVAFTDAPFPMKVLMILLVVATIAAVFVTIRKLASGPHLNGGSAYLSALRLGGPLFGLLGVAHALMSMSLGAANINMTLPLAAYAPGFVEASFVFGLGLVAGITAVIGHWIVEARIDRAVLRP